MKKAVAALIVALSGHYAFACGTYFDETYIVGASPNRAFTLPELSMARELKEIPLAFEYAAVQATLPEDVTLQSLCAITNQFDTYIRWYNDRVNPTMVAELTDLYAYMMETGADAADLCRRYFCLRAGIDKRVTERGLEPAKLSLLDHLETLAELPREFYLYLEGARAFHQKKYGEAKDAFDALLALPEGERRYRTTWSFFMLGRMAVMARRDPGLARAHPEIVTDPLPFFELVRQSAAEGFVDTHNLAAGTYQQEALLAANACDFVGELHALARYNLADHQYDPRTALKRASINLAAMDAIPPEVLADRLSRSVLVAFAASHVDARPKLAERILLDLNPSDLELTPYESGRLAWTAYALGRMDDATALVNMAPEEPYAIWTQSRLRLRRGDLKGAVEALKKAAPLFSHDDSWDRFDEEDIGAVFRPRDALHNEQAVLQLSRDRYVEALELFMVGESWLDAAYVAEHVLTLDELLVFYRRCEDEKRFTEPSSGFWRFTVYEVPPIKPNSWRRDREEKAPPTLLERLRVLVGRRMLREERYTGAAELFPAEWRHLAEAYIHHRVEALSAKHDRERASHLALSAHLLRHWGMELTGYEADPDFTYTMGSMYYQNTLDVRGKPATWRKYAARAMKQSDYVEHLGESWEEEYDENWLKALPAYVAIAKPTPGERRRLKENRPEHYRRFHYRFDAADLFEQAAGLLPNESEEKAQALYYGGQVLKKVIRYPDTGARMDRFYKALARQCGTLDVGRAAAEKTWFPEEPEDWGRAFGPAGTNEAALALAKKATPPRL